MIITIPASKVRLAVTGICPRHGTPYQLVGKRGRKGECLECNREFSRARMARARRRAKAKGQKIKADQKERS